MEKYSLNDCIKNLADIQKEVANGCKFVTYNYELAVLAVIAAFKRIGYRDLFFPVHLSDSRNAKQVDGMVLCPENTHLITIVQVKCIKDRGRTSHLPSLSRSLNSYLFRHYRYMSVMNDDYEDINYALVNYDYNVNVGSLKKAEIKNCSYDFFSILSEHDNHIMRVEKMLQHIEHYKDDETYKPTYKWLHEMLNYIYQCSHVEHRCASTHIVNSGMYKISSIRLENESA